MSSYDELPTIIGQMKRAAIDSYMSEVGWPPHVMDDSYYSLWGFIGASSYIRPATDGSGGGEASGFSEAGGSMAPSFDSIRSAIDSYTSPWLDLPDGTRCSTPRQATSSAAAIFGASGTGGSVQNNGEIATSNQTVSDVLISNIQGSFTAPFHDKYYSQFAKVVSGLGAASAILEINYAAQAQIWPAARVDVTTICDHARNAWSVDAKLSADKYSAITLTVIGAVAGAVATVATAGAAAPAVAVLVGISTVATSAMAGLEASASVSGDSYADILGSLGEALGTLNARIAAQEDALNTMMVNAMTAMGDDLPSFNLDQFTMQAYPGVADTLGMQQFHAGMVTTNMTRILDALGSAESAFGSAPSTSPTARDYRIGAGSSGTHSNAYELHSLTAQCLNRTYAEYERGQKLFDAAVADYFSADADATTLVNSLAADEALTSDA